MFCCVSEWSNPPFNFLTISNCIIFISYKINSSFHFSLLKFMLLLLFYSFNFRLIWNVLYFISIKRFFFFFFLKKELTYFVWVCVLFLTTLVVFPYLLSSSSIFFLLCIYRCNKTAIYDQCTSIYVLGRSACSNWCYCWWCWLFRQVAF